jgi:hypothetical protein
MTRAGHRVMVRSEVTLEGWIFMVGLRVFDVGALIVWLVWFFKLRDDDDDAGGDDDHGRGDEPQEPPPDGGGGLELPLPDAQPSAAATTAATGRPRPPPRTGRPIRGGSPSGPARPHATDRSISLSGFWRVCARSGLM